MADGKKKTVFEIILDWSEKRCDWQRDALRRIVKKGKLESTDIADLSIICKEGRKEDQSEISAKFLAAEHVPARSMSGNVVSLNYVKDVTGVNRLASGQELRFLNQGITIVYGDNGVGKSGYTRILKRACRSRFPGEILPNAFSDTNSGRPEVSAVIGYSAHGLPPSEYRLEHNKASNDFLSIVSVFDRESGFVHLKEKNEVAFRPFGLDIPDELAAACVSLKDSLSKELEYFRNSQDPLFRNLKISDTKAGNAIKNLSGKSDLVYLRTLCVLTKDELDRLGRLTKDLAQDPLKSSQQYRIWAQEAEILAKKISALELRLSDENLKCAISLSVDARAKRAAASIAAKSAYSDSLIKGVGESVWKLLWESARNYSEKIAYPGHEFPHVGDKSVCLLCQQPISKEIGQRLTGFEEFIKRDAEEQARNAEEKSEEFLKKNIIKAVSGVDFSFRRQLGLLDKELAMLTLRFISILRVRRAVCISACHTDLEFDVPVLPESPVNEILRHVNLAKNYASELANAADIEKRKKLEAECNELKDRSYLGEIIDKVESEVGRLSSIALIEECINETSTKAITNLGNSIADQFVTPKVQERFKEEISRIAGDRVKVEMIRSGGKFGSPHYQVRLAENERAKVGSILSEGEQTCVALAAFLTELATSEHKSTLVFDDPVSSLDHRWRHRVARRLVEEASARQIIVFTHDLVFLNDLHSLSGDSSVPISMITLTKNASGTGIVNSGLPWIGAKVKERLDSLEKDAREARYVYEKGDEEEYSAMASEVYSKLRSTWERALEDVAFCGVIVRHRDYINAKELLKVSVLTEEDVEKFKIGFKKCCDQTEAHDPSRGRNASSPPPNDIINDVHELRKWVDNIRLRQKGK